MDSQVINQLISRLESLEAEVTELRKAVRMMPPVSSMLSMAERHRIVSEARASGDRGRLIRAHRLVNGELS